MEYLVRFDGEIKPFDALSPVDGGGCTGYVPVDVCVGKETCERNICIINF